MVVMLKFNVLAAAHHECGTHDWAASGEKARGAREGSKKSKCSGTPLQRAGIY